MLKKDLIDFIHSSAKDANNKNEESMKLTGKDFDFPKEDELVYS